MAKNFNTLENQVWLPHKFAVGHTFYRFYEGLKEEKILGNQCPKCGKTLVPPRTFCPCCFVDMGEWKEVSQEGSVVTWTFADRRFFGMPFDPPFIGALISLDGTDCNFLHIIGGFDLSDPDILKNRINRKTRVKAVWSDKKKGHMLDIRYFKPV